METIRYLRYSTGCEQGRKFWCNALRLLTPYITHYAISVGCYRRRRRCQFLKLVKLRELLTFGASVAFVSTSILCKSPCGLSINISLERCASKNFGTSTRAVPLVYSEVKNLPKSVSLISANSVSLAIRQLSDLRQGLWLAFSFW